MVLVIQFRGKAVVERAEVKPQKTPALVKQPGKLVSQIAVIGGLRDTDMKIPVGFDHGEHVALRDGGLESSLMGPDDRQLRLGAVFGRQARGDPLKEVEGIDVIGILLERRGVTMVDLFGRVVTRPSLANRISASRTGERDRLNCWPVRTSSSTSPGAMTNRKMSSRNVR